LKKISFRRFLIKRKTAINLTRLPRHIAIIMDGNGRWASRRGLPRSAGHRAGSEAFRRLAYYCRDIGIAYLTVYAFSTENWSRPQSEVDAIMALLKEYLLESCEKMVRENIGLHIIGDPTRLDEDLRALIRRTDELSEGTTGLQVNVCLNYGGRAEIVRAVQRIVAAGLSPEQIGEDTLSSYMYTAGQRDPDVIIRTGGEMRVSNFLLWQAAYAEYYSTPVFWPDFDEAELQKALVAYGQRQRRFGKV
jgi:undecaprenyl diphosphate synthase